MRPEALKAPAGAPFWASQLVQSITRVFQTVTGGGEPQRMFVVVDNASAPPAADWQYCVCVSEDADGLGNPGLIWSDGTNWTAL